MRRLGLIGDVHGEDGLLEQVLGWLAAAEVDLILCTGDLVDGFGDIDRCCGLLEAYGVLTVRGNHDRWLLEGYGRDLNEATHLDDLTSASRRFLASLPATRTLRTPRGELLLCHGLGRNDMARLLPDDTGYVVQANAELQALIANGQYQMVVAGHTHWRMVRRVLGLTVINPGTLYRAHDPCYAVLELETGRVVFHNLVSTSERVPAEVFPLV